MTIFEISDLLTLRTNLSIILQNAQGLFGNNPPHTLGGGHHVDWLFYDGCS